MGGAGRQLRTQGRRTRTKLLDAGVQVLTERGYHAARVDDVVRMAKVSHGTFYLYFANKEDLFRALAERCAEEMAELAASMGTIDAGESGIDELRAWLHSFMALYRTYGAVIRAWMEDQNASRDLSVLGAKAFAQIASSYELSIHESTAHPDGDAEGDADVATSRLRAAAMLALIERFTYFLTSRNLDFDADRTIDTLATLIYRGFFAPTASPT